MPQNFSCYKECMHDYSLLLKPWKLPGGVGIYLLKVSFYTCHTNNYNKEIKYRITNEHTTKYIGTGLGTSYHLSTHTTMPILMIETTNKPATQHSFNKPTTFSTNKKRFQQRNNILSTNNG